MAPKMFYRISLGVCATALLVASAQQGLASTVHTVTSSQIVFVDDPNNDPAPLALNCSSVDGYCGDTAANTTAYFEDADGNATVVDIASDALAKYDLPNTKDSEGNEIDPKPEPNTGTWSQYQTSNTFSMTFDALPSGSDTVLSWQSGTWTQQINDLSEQMVHYIVTKASSDWIVWELDIASITLSVGDVLTGTWSTEGLENDKGKQRDLSHLSFYNSVISQEGPPPSAVPIPAALVLLFSALSSLGLLGWHRNRVNTA